MAKRHRRESETQGGRLPPSDALAMRGPSEVEPAPSPESELPLSTLAESVGPEEPEEEEAAPDEFLFSCPGCPMVWSSDVYSNRDQAEAAFKSHVYRHEHARPHESAPGSRFTRHP